MIVIKDMDMPKTCGGCRMSGTDVCTEWFGLKGYEMGNKRADTCPLQEIGGTNGEVMELLFGISLNDFKATWGGGDITDEWWNASYKTESEG
jgi:hypothetical protein